MKRVMVTRFGGPEVLQLVEAPTPEPGPTDLRIRVRAAGLNYADLLRRMGLYPGGPKPPFGAGFEAAGVVDAIGAKVTGFRAGDEVTGFVDCAFSEFAIADGRFLMAKPEGYSFAEAAALPCQYLTAYHALVTVGKLAAGQSVLIQAAAGGLGTMLVQIAKALGAVVFGTASTADKLELARSLGCDHPINYRDTDFHEVVQKVTGGRGCDLAVESVGGDVFHRSLECVRTRGRMITLGAASLSPAKVDAATLTARSLTLSGLMLGPYLVDRAATDRALADFEKWRREGKLRVIVGRTFPLEEAAAAQQFMADRKSVGKIVLLVD